MIRVNLVSLALYAGFLSLGCGGSNQSPSSPSSVNEEPHADMSDPAGAGMTVGTGGATGKGYGAGADSGSGGH